MYEDWLWKNMKAVKGFTEQIKWRRQIRLTRLSEQPRLQPKITIYNSWPLLEVNVSQQMLPSVPYG